MTQPRQLTFYAVALFAALLNEVATIYGVEMCTLLPLLLVAWRVWVWAFDVK